MLSLLLVACESRGGYVGTYRAELERLSKKTEVVMELKANGDGLWKMADEEIPFTWYVKSGELRINTKGGGVIVGSATADAIQVILPGTGPMLLKKIL